MKRVLVLVLALAMAAAFVCCDSKNPEQTTTEAEVTTEAAETTEEPTEAPTEAPATTEEDVTLPPETEAPTIEIPTQGAGLEYIPPEQMAQDQSGCNGVLLLPVSVLLPLVAIALTQYKTKKGEFS